MDYTEQRKVLNAAKDAGWPGEVPSVLGGYFANRAVADAERFLREACRIREAEPVKRKEAHNETGST